MKLTRRFLLLFVTVMLAGCASEYVYTGGTRGSRPYTVLGKTYYPLQSANNYSETGVASWYGPKFHGKQTASGERYDQYKMTAAHKTLPLGTTVRVTNLENNRSVVVRVNDRGPFVDDRIIDLSRAAASHLDMIGNGTARVRVESIGNTTPSTVDVQSGVHSSGNVYIQVGSFGEISNAQNLSAQVTRDGYNNRVHKLPSGLNAVQIGPFANRDAATPTLNRLRSVYPGAFFAE